MKNSGLVFSHRWSGISYAANSASQQASAEHVLKHLPFKHQFYPKTILDIGCGDGKITKNLASHYNKATVVGYDSSQSMIEYASEHNAHANIQYKVCRANAVYGKHDLITCFNALQWFPRQLETLSQIWSCVDQNGLFMMCMPYGYPQPLIKGLTDKRWNGKYRDMQFFYSVETYEMLFKELNNCHIELFQIFEKMEEYDDIDHLFSFIQQWLPQVRASQRHKFISHLKETYMIEQPLDKNGKATFHLNVLEVIAYKKD